MTSNNWNIPFRKAIPYAYEHSIEVDPSMYETEQFLFNVRPRISKFPAASDYGCFEVRDDWLAATGREHMPSGSMDPIGGNMVAVCYVESTKARAFALGYVNEYLLIQDDIVDIIETPETDIDATQFGWSEELKNAKIKSDAERLERVKFVKNNMIAQLMLDPSAGIHVLDEIKKFTTQQYDNRKFDWKNRSVLDYIEFRHADLGTDFISACAGFGVVPPILPHEVASVHETTKAGYACAILVNDIWSWDKEWIDFNKEGNFPVSAVWLLMQREGVDPATAKELVKGELLKAVRRYETQAFKCIEGLPVDSPIVRWFGLLDLVLAGNALWSMTCPRYHLENPQFRKEDLPPRERLDIEDQFIKAGDLFEPPDAVAEAKIHQIDSVIDNEVSPRDSPEVEEQLETVRDVYTLPEATSDSKKTDHDSGIVDIKVD